MEKHDAAVQLAPDDPKTLVNAGVTFSAAGDLRRAKEMFEKAAKLDPTNEDAKKNLEALNKLA